MTTPAATNIASPETKKLPSNAAVRAIKAYWIELCAEKKLDPRTGKSLRRTKGAHVARTAVRVAENSIADQIAHENATAVSIVHRVHKLIGMLNSM